MKIKINTVQQRANVNFNRRVANLAICDVSFPDMEATIKGIGLNWNGKNYIASFPRPNNVGGGIGWNVRGKFAIELAEHMVEAYKGVGGKLPDAKPKRLYIPFSELELSPDEGLSMRERIEDALEDESRKRGVECYTEVYERTEPEPDYEETDGLHRVLGIDPAVSEACDRAGL